MFFWFLDLQAFHSMVNLDMEQTKRYVWSRSFLHFLSISLKVNYPRYLVVATLCGFVMWNNERKELKQERKKLRIKSKEREGKAIKKKNGVGRVCNFVFHSLWKFSTRSMSLWIRLNVRNLNKPVDCLIVIIIKKKVLISNLMRNNQQK